MPFILAHNQEMCQNESVHNIYMMLLKAKKKREARLNRRKEEKKSEISICIKCRNNF